MRFAARRPAPGHTLAEMLTVVAVLSVIAFLVKPSSAALQPVAVDAAVKEVVQALRFAQADAIRCGTYRTVSFDTQAENVRVYGLDFSVKPPREDLVNPVNHPLDKKAYNVTLYALPGTSGVSINKAQFVYTGVAPKLTRVTFGADGVPIEPIGPNPPDMKPLSVPGTVEIIYGTILRTVTIDPDTGRVTVSS